MGRDTEVVLLSSGSQYQSRGNGVQSSAGTAAPCVANKTDRFSHAGLLFFLQYTVARDRCVRKLHFSAPVAGLPSKSAQYHAIVTISHRCEMTRRVVLQEAQLCKKAPSWTHHRKLCTCLEWKYHAKRRTFSGRCVFRTTKEFDDVRVL